MFFLENFLFQWYSGGIIFKRVLDTLSFEFISFILRDFSLSSRAFYLENGDVTILSDKKPENLSKTSYENKQNKLKAQVRQSETQPFK